MKQGADGFALVEVVVATSIFAVGLVTLAQLALAARRSDWSAAVLTTASVLAQDKMEQLRAQAWPASGSAVCCEYFDAQAARLTDGGTTPIGTMYVRGWSIVPLPALPEGALSLHVWVAPRDAATVRLTSVRASRVD